MALDVVEEAQVGCGWLFGGQGTADGGATFRFTFASCLAEGLGHGAVRTTPPGRLALLQGRFHVWGTTPGGASVLLRLPNFQPYFYVAAPKAQAEGADQDVEWDQHQLQRLQARRRALPPYAAERRQMPNVECRMLLNAMPAGSPPMLLDASRTCCPLASKPDGSDARARSAASIVPLTDSVGLGGLLAAGHAQPHPAERLPPGRHRCGAAHSHPVLQVSRQ